MRRRHTSCHRFPPWEILAAFALLPSLVSITSAMVPTQKQVESTVAPRVARAALASLGWYMIERTGGPLQIPAFALAMMAWPEGAMLDQRRLTPVPPAFYIQLSVLLIASTLAVSCLVAVIAAKSRFGRVRM